MEGNAAAVKTKGKNHLVHECLIRAIKSLQEAAVNADTNGRHTAALVYYRQTVTLMKLVLSWYATTGETPLHVACATYEARINTLDPTPTHTPTPPSPSPSPSPSPTPPSGNNGIWWGITFPSEVPVGVSWKDVVGDPETIKAIERRVCMQLQFPRLFKRVTSTYRNSILFYGPPGTGKTFFARLIAASFNYLVEKRKQKKIEKEEEGVDEELLKEPCTIPGIVENPTPVNNEKEGGEEKKMTMIMLSSGDITGKYFGESEQRIKALFDQAFECQPSLIFIDEIDALMSQRNTDGGANGGGGGGGVSSEVMGRIKSHLLVQLDRLVGQPRVVFVGTTNLPAALDDGFIRRFTQRILIPMPDESIRRKLFHAQFTEKALIILKGPVDENNRMTNDEISTFISTVLVPHTKQWSTYDITLFMEAIAMVPVERLQNATHFRSLAPPSLTRLIPCLPDTLGAMPLDYRELDDEQMEPMDDYVTMEDIQAELLRFPAAGPFARMDEINRFTDRIKKV